MLSFIVTVYVGGQQIKKFYRFNHQINATQLRVIDAEGKQLGVLSKEEALKAAQAQELDLVEIAPEAKPPVAKIIDYKKFQYLEERKLKEARKNTRETELKEVRFTPFIGDHDLEVGLKKVRKFLGEGDLVKVSIIFKGRQMIHTEFGPKLLERIKTLLEGEAEQERTSRFEGKRYISILKPTKAIIQKAQQQKAKSKAQAKEEITDETTEKDKQPEENKTEQEQEQNETEN